MKFSRRDFLQTATLSAGGVCIAGPKLFNPVHSSGDAPVCSVIDLGSQCILRESLLGYQAAFAEAGLLIGQPDKANWIDAGLVVVPGAGAMTEPVFEMLLRALQQGANVLLESAAGFCGLPDFAAFQLSLHRHFDLQVEPPFDRSLPDSREDTLLSPRLKNAERSGSKWTPYIEYVWPARAIVRDFSKVIPVASNEANAIAYAGSRPVAVRKRVGQGQLIFLGSPLGPGLRAGEPEAHAWLGLIMSGR